MKALVVTLMLGVFASTPASANPKTKSTKDGIRKCFDSDRENSAGDAALLLPVPGRGREIKLQLIKNPGNDPNEPPLLKLAGGVLTVQLYDGVSNIDSVISDWVTGKM